MLRQIFITSFISIASIQSTENNIDKNKPNIINQITEDHPKKVLLCGTILMISGVGGVIYCALNNKTPFLRALSALTFTGGLYLTLESATQKQTNHGLPPKLLPKSLPSDKQFNVHILTKKGL